MSTSGVASSPSFFFFTRCCFGICWLISSIFKNILFICGGAFPDLDSIIKERLTKQSAIGFGADLKDKYDHDKKILEKVTTEDLRNFGMIPEFLGRLPVVFTLQGLTEDMYVKILEEPKNAILKQYQIRKCTSTDK